MTDGEDRRVVTAKLEGGPNVLVEVRTPADTEEDVGIGDLFSFDRITDSIQAIADRMASALENAKPNKATVEFGVDVGVEAGALTALIAKGTGSATIKVT